MMVKIMMTAIVATIGTIEVEEDSSERLNELSLLSRDERLISRDRGKLLFNVSRDEIPEIVSQLNSMGIKIFSVSYRRALEEYFLKLTTENYHS